jgi:hypothetical protein
MNLTALRRSLQTKLLAAVIVCVVVPLAAVGAWLTSTAPRSGEFAPAIEIGQHGVARGHRRASKLAAAAVRRPFLGGQ